LFNTAVEFGIGLPTKYVSLIKMCLNENYDKIHIGKDLFDVFRIQNGLRQ